MPGQHSEVILVSQLFDADDPGECGLDDLADSVSAA